MISSILAATGLTVIAKAFAGVFVAIRFAHRAGGGAMAGVALAVATR